MLYGSFCFLDFGNKHQNKYLLKSFFISIIICLFLATLLFFLLSPIFFLPLKNGVEVYYLKGSNFKFSKPISKNVMVNKNKVVEKPIKQQKIQKKSVGIKKYDKSLFKPKLNNLGLSSFPVNENSNRGVKKKQDKTNLGNVLVQKNYLKRLKQKITSYKNLATVEGEISFLFNIDSRGVIYGFEVISTNNIGLKYWLEEVIYKKMRGFFEEFPKEINLQEIKNIKLTVYIDR